MRRYRKASRCCSGNCVYVAVLRDTVLVRQDRRERPTLEFTYDEWREFAAAIRRGEFAVSDQHDIPA